MLLALVQVLGLSLGFHICHEFTLLKSLYAEFQIAFKVDVLICFVILFIWLIFFFFFWSGMYGWAFWQLWFVLCSLIEVVFRDEFLGYFFQCKICLGVIVRECLSVIWSRYVSGLWGLFWRYPQWGFSLLVWCMG